MNILHLKYAVEVEKTRSISKAAENLFMGQPNLSRAIRELESSLGITIFKRTSKGITVTPQGEDFLSRAKNILSQIDEMENYYKTGQGGIRKFSLSAPRASFVCSAFAEFASTLDRESPAEIYYKETNSIRAIDNLLQADYKLGIIRFQTLFESYYKALFHEKGIASQTIVEYSCVALMSVKNPLAWKESISQSDLAGYVEIANPDHYVPSLPFADAMKAEMSDFTDQHIYVYERASQFELLDKVDNSFMWVSAIPQDILDKYGLVQKKCPDNEKRYKDVLIYRKGYHFTDLDRKFLDILDKYKAQV
ncbi:MAG: LysR family transcriptional regulator [Eubacteriales bacterium]